MNGWIHVHGTLSASRWTNLSWVDLSTIIAATAGLWALAFAWVTYVMSVRERSQDEFLALQSITTGLRAEMELINQWAGAGGPGGYSKTMKLADAPPDWSWPGRLIWKFDCEAIRNLSSSPYLYRLGEIVGPFSRLSLSISRLFQLYDEYRSFVNSDPAVVLAASVSRGYKDTVLQFNFDMHVKLIGGADSDDPDCLYKAYAAAAYALVGFNNGLKKAALPRWFWLGHLVSTACLLSGVFLLVRVVFP